VRHVVQDEPDVDFMLRPNFLRASASSRRSTSRTTCLFSQKQLPAAIELLKRFPEQTFVLDHIAKPLIKDGVLSPWREQIRELAKAPNIICKVSGMVTEADPLKWNQTISNRISTLFFAAFAEDRLMYGSDWPVCLLAGSYERVLGLVDNYTQQLTESARANFFGGNAARFYRIKDGASGVA